MWGWEFAVDMWPANSPHWAKGLCNTGTRCEQVDFIFAGSHSLMAAAGGSITAVPCLSRNEKSWSGSCGKSMYRSTRFVRIDSGHEHQMGVCACAYACLHMRELHTGIPITSSVGQWRRRSCITVKICTDMLGYPVLSVLSVEPIRNMDLFSYAPCHADIWFIPLWADTLVPIWHQSDTLTLCDASENSDKLLPWKMFFMPPENAHYLSTTDDTANISIALFSPHSPSGYTGELCVGLKIRAPSELW